jgi:hypothetical protein
MAAAVATPTVQDIKHTWVAGDAYFVHATITISASPATYTSGGIVCNLLIPLIKASRTPRMVQVQGISGYTYAYIKGTDASNGLLKVLVQDGVSQDPLAELTNAGAIPAGVSGDTIEALIIFGGQN